MALGPTVRRRRTITLTTLLVTVLALVLAGCGPQDVTVRTSDGSLTGVDDGTTLRFLGIRYAQAPARWTLPVPAGRWEGTRQATTPGPSCPQTNPGPGVEQSEDCLFLDVTTPRDVQPDERLPVFVWWHGGGFVNGSGSTYDPQRLADQGRLAVVTVNYRLGTLGYLGLPGLDGSGAFGFADQLQSLRWTRENIAAFGGDPDNITVAGQSAGGAATCALLSSPALARYAVRHVIVMSGACSTSLPTGGFGLRAPERGLYTSTAGAQAAGRAAAAELGCPPDGALDCLRDVPVPALLAQNQRFSTLAWGGDLLPVNPAANLRNAPSSVPVLYGGTRDEGRTWFARPAEQNPAAFTPANYTRLLTAAFGPDAGRVEQQYPLSRYRNSGALAWSAVVTDSGWACPARRDIGVLAGAGVPTYGFEFSRPDGPAGPDGFPSGGAGHASDLALLFDRPQTGTPAPEGELADLVVRYWASFARTGRPAADGAPAWRAQQAGEPVTPLQLDPASIRPVDTGAIHDCGFWSSIR